MSESEFDNDKVVYQGNKVPLFIKIAWIVLIVWLIAYLIYFALPDLMQWV